MELCGESARETERFVVTAATGALGPVLVKLDALLGDEYKLEEGTRQEIKSIKSELEPVHDLLGKLWGREDLDVECKGWITEARELSYDMDDDIDDFIQREATDSPFKEFMGRVKDVSKLYPEMKKIGDAIVCNRSKLSTDPRANFLHKDASELVGMEEKKKELLMLLEEHEMVCIVGFAGTGKTTLADLVYRTIGHKFECRAFVSVHPSPNMMEILRAILSQVTNNGATSTGSATEDAAEQNIIHDISVFLSDKRYLVIIDDIWHWKEWEIIRKALPKNNQGCKIIMTTRINTTAEKCETEQGAYLYAQSLDLFDAKRLSDMILNKSAEGDTLEDELWYGIADMSCGMPLAVICLSSAWAEIQVEGGLGEWQTFVRSHLLGGGFLSIPSLKPLVQSLWLYFEDLPVHVRTCLLYCTIFSPFCYIRRECLVRMWTAEGFVSQEEVAEAYIDQLVSRNLLQPQRYDEVENSTYYIVHRLMLGFLVCKAKEDNFVACRQYNVPSGSWHAKQIRRLSLDFMDRCPDEDLSHTRSLVVHGQPKDGGVTLDKFANLRVLEISRNLGDMCGLMRLRYLCLKGLSISDLPREIVRLQYLEILDIRWTYIGELPMEICNLQRLKILDASENTNLYKLPSEIWKLQSLEILDASRTGVTELPTEVEKLQHLRTLNISCSEVTELPTGITRLKLLKHLDVSRTGVRELPKEIWKLQNLRTLNISGTKVTKLPTEITKLELLEILDLSWTGVRELPKEIWKLQHLSTLDVRGTKVRELSCSVIPNSLSVLVGDKKSSPQVVKLPQAVSADGVISSYRAERREDLSIFVLIINSHRCSDVLPVAMLSVVGRHMKVPQWVKQELHNVCFLHIGLYKLGKDDLTILKEMPYLQALALRLEVVLLREPIAITSEGFSNLVTFYIDCRLPRVITFKEGAMPKLKHFEFKFYNSTASQGYSMGIKNLVSLEKVVFRCSENYRSDSQGISATFDVVRKEAEEHNNEIILWVNEKHEFFAKRPSGINHDVEAIAEKEFEEWKEEAEKWGREIKEKAKQICEQRQLLLTAVERRAEREKSNAVIEKKIRDRFALLAGREELEDENQRKGIRKKMEIEESVGKIIRKKMGIEERVGRALDQSLRLLTEEESPAECKKNNPEIKIKDPKINMQSIPRLLREAEMPDGWKNNPVIEKEFKKTICILVENMKKKHS